MKFHSLLFFVLCFAAERYREEMPRYVHQETIEEASLIDSYVNICTRTFSREEFEEILAKDVFLFHQTNDQPPMSVQGKEKVGEFFFRYVFNNTSDVVIQNIVQSENQKGRTLFLSLEETKDEEASLSRYHFEEETHFVFSGTPGKKRISQIHMNVKKNLL